MDQKELATYLHELDDEFGCRRRIKPATQFFIEELCEL